jgi:glucan phosphoethanolaminetransferase (alkaline phosphatase superfamily)
MQKVRYSGMAGGSAARPSGRVSAVLLACWLLLPTLAGLWAGRHAPEAAFSMVGVAMLAIAVLATPLVLLGSARRLFLFWLPAGLLAPLQLYLIYFFGSVPGDALTKAALQMGGAETLELLTGFGPLVLLLPLSWIAYLLLWRRVDPALRLSSNARKTLAAAVLTYAAVGLLSEQELGRYVTIPPLFNLALASSTYPAGNVVSLLRVRDAEAAGSVASMRVHAAAPGEPQLVILVIGETVRPDHLGINGYARNTTPQLARLGPALLSFSNVASTTNHTAGAVPNLVRRQVAGGDISLVSVFREAGFYTGWFSNQQRTVYEPQADLMDFSQAGWHEKMRQDTDLLPLLAACIKQCGARQFIVLHMYGSHYPYDERYGRRDQQFEPVLRDAGSSVSPRYKRELINSYDNTLLGTDRFLAAVIAHAAAAGKPAVVLFTSDHGENLFDDERQMVLHAGPNPTRSDTLVPLLFWTNDAFARANAAKIAAMRTQLAAPLNHLAVMPTLLDLAGISYDGKSATQSLASASFQPIKRVVEGSDHASVAFDTLR